MRRYIFPVFILLLAVTSCKYKLKDRPNWDTELTAPLLKSRISLEDALKDTSIVHINPDNSIIVVFRDTLLDIKLSDYLVVPDTSYKNKVTLDSITLSTDTLTQDITLGQIGRQLQSQGDPIGDLIMNNHGNTLPFFPGANNLSSADIPIDASQFFDEADLIDGWMIVEINNQLPVTITSTTFHLRNNGVYSDTLVKKTMGPINPGQTKKDSASLAGKTVESQMAGQLEDIDIAGGTNIPIDTNDYIRMQIIVRDLHASRATAVFPGQTVINDLSRIKYQFGTGVEITRMKVDSGHLEIRALSTLQDTIEFTFSLPTAIKNGQPVVVMDRLIPDTILGVAEANKVFDLSGYYIDLTFNGDSVNLFPYHLLGDLIYSGRKNTMDLADSIDIFYGLLDIYPDYIEGYLGTESFSYIETIDLDFFNSILGGTLDLTNPKVDLTLSNSIGVDGQLKINQLDAVNTRSGQTVSLTGSMMNRPLEVIGPKLPNVGQTVITQFNLSKNNSNITDFVSLLPDRLDFDLAVDINKNANPELRNNFAVASSALSAFLDMEIPLEGIADHLILQDTLALNVSDVALPDEIVDGTLKLVVENQFPFDAGVQIYFFNQTGFAFDSLFAGGMQVIPAGIIDQNGYVSTPGKGVLETTFSQERLDQLKLQGYEAIIRFDMSTKPNGTPVKIYSTYGIDFHLIGDFRYSVGL